MRPPAIEALLRSQTVVWEGNCTLTGVGAFAEATHRLYVTAAGDLLFYHGPECGGLLWTHAVAAPHSPGTMLARWEPAGAEFIVRFDRNWDPMVATWVVPGCLPPGLWAALRPHLHPSAREQSPLWQSRFYCRGTLHAPPATPGDRAESGEPESGRPRFIRLFAHEHHLSLSVCSAQDGEQIGLYGALTAVLPYAALIPAGAATHRRRWRLAPALTVGGHAIDEMEIEIPAIEAADWAALDRLIAGHRGPEGLAAESDALEVGVYEIEGTVAGQPLGGDWVHLLLEPEALVLRGPGTGGLIATIPYAAIHACAIERHDPADDFLVVAPGLAVCLRQAGVGVRHQVEHGAGFALLRQKLAARAAAVVRHLTGIPGRPATLPTALFLEGDTLQAAWGIGTASLPVAETRTRRVEREAQALEGGAGQVRLVVGRPGQEWTACGMTERLLPLAQALEEAALPGELAHAGLAELYRRWQERWPEPLLWGALSEIVWVELQLRALAERAPEPGAHGDSELASARGRVPTGTVGVTPGGREPSTERASGGDEGLSRACDLLAMNLENVKARLALMDLQLPYWAAGQEETFLRHLGDAAAPVRERSCRYTERAVKVILRSAQAHLQHGLAEIEKNLAIRDQLRQAPRPGKLTLGFDASYCATVATAIGASMLGPLGAVAGVALSGLHLNQETHSQNALQASLIHDYEANALTWWRHLAERVVPLLVREFMAEGERLSRSLAARDGQIYARLAALGPHHAEPRFRQALTQMLLGLARFRWGRLEAGDGEWITVGEILDRLLAAPPPLPTYSQLFPTAAPPVPDLAAGAAP